MWSGDLRNPDGSVWGRPEETVSPNWFLQPGWTQTFIALARIPTIFLRVGLWFFLVDFFSYLILCHQLGTPIFNYNSCDIYRQNNLA